jgi:hypothetical protein
MIYTSPPLFPSVIYLIFLQWGGEWGGVPYSVISAIVLRQTNTINKGIALGVEV